MGKNDTKDLIAQKRLSELCDELKEKGISNRSIVKKMFMDLGYDDFDNQYTRFNKVKKGKGNYVIDEEYAKKICDAINRYPWDHTIHSGNDIRWQWIAGLDNYKTYRDENYGEYEKELRRADRQEKARWKVAPFRLIESCFSELGYSLYESIDPLTYKLPGHPSNYIVEKPGEEGVILSGSEFAAMLEELRSYAFRLVEDVIDRHNQ